MAECDLLVTSKYLIPVVPHDVVIEDGCLVVKDGVILDVGKFEELNPKYKPREFLDLGHQLILPGLINSHTHAGMTHMRGMAEDLKLADWLMNEIWPAEAKHLSPDFTKDGTELAVAEMIKGGVTCMVDMYFYPEAAAEVLNRVGMRGVLGVPLLDFPTNYAKSFDEYLEKAEAAVKETAALLASSPVPPLVTYAVAPHAPYTVCDDHLVRAWKVAKDNNVPFHIHLHETAAEVQDSISGQESMSRHRSSQLCSPLKNFERLGLVGPNLMAVHVTQITEEEIKILSDSGSHVVHCPESNLKLVSGFCPVQKLLDSGINVCLGTDSAASNNDLSMLGEIKTAALLGKMVAGDPGAMKGQTVIRMATINAAKASGLEKITGSLEAGKRADFISVDFDLLHFQPIFNPAVGLIYSAQASHVQNVWVDGKPVLKNQKFLTIDESDLRQRILSWNKKLKEKV